MANCNFTGKAQQDLYEIAEHTQTHWGRAQARAYLDGIEDGCQNLANNPGIGKNRDDIAEGLKSFPVESHVIYYICLGENIAVIRILHGRMLPANHHFRTVQA